MPNQAKRDYVTLEDISSRAWEHPADRAALSALRAVPGLDTLLKSVFNFTFETGLRMLFLGASVRTSEKQFPRLHGMLTTACQVLDVKDRPEMYVSQNHQVNAYAIGANKPFIVLNSALVDMLDDAELLAVIAHELGHIASGHAMYKTLLWYLARLNAAQIQNLIPGGILVYLAVIGALCEWDRKSELSSDRAGLLVVQDADVSYRTLMKLAGGKNLGEMDLEEFFRQAKEYDEAGSFVNSVHKLLNTLFQTHPLPVLRVTELKTWHSSGTYQAILDGGYERRKPGEGTAGDSANFGKDFAEAQKQYQEDMKRSEDPLAKFVNNVGDSISKFFGGGGGT